MTTDEQTDLIRRIESIVNAYDSPVDVTDVEVAFRDDHADEPSVYVTVGMAGGASVHDYALFLTEVTGLLSKETRTSDGFLFPYVRSRIEEEAA